MSGWKLGVVWVACVLVGAAIGYGIGWAIWKLGFELIGSAVALVGAAVGGILLLFAFMSWYDDREMARDAKAERIP